MSMMINTQANRRPANGRTASFFTRLMQANALMRQRHALRMLDQAALDDMGLSRAQADAEARRPIWDAPNAWLK
ncbi:hypothetical protein TG4357_01092 [Thalassovita gelatinovora]|uniref:YjiS-like domain-containing protein n=1 Tax=Thalassovita gelatinovora TaxID=53501 RepID=A0A0P1F7Y5_THAGE|nr:DUF1127 domain-containing protein [Thalassovita gelatinovora]QIZ80255.1 DUF1127 domain-containing protein [Thalassovita gelatinovora]CUH64127.1 hypothetical protein TG4357_01092 [Thalassovita gelatinovora]SEQ83952.1 protein of unknown function [Thalassovita gelatinovora]